MSWATDSMEKLFLRKSVLFALIANRGGPDETAALEALCLAHASCIIEAEQAKAKLSLAEKILSDLIERIEAK